MASVLTTLAFCAGVAFAATPSCPKEHATVTSTDTWSAATTISDYKTVTEDPETWTRTLSSYDATITASAAGNDPSTSVISILGSARCNGCQLISKTLAMLLNRFRNREFRYGKRVV